MVNKWEDYVAAGFRVFGLHGVTNGKCDCGNPECEALYKHPIVKGWQNTPDWSDEQLETMQMAGHFDTGFGVLCDGYIIVDVDYRNGGVESWRKIIENHPEIAWSNFIVKTGSGNGSLHAHFKAPKGVAFVQHIDGYPGIDIKTSGFVVGAGSLHASGNRYEAVIGSPYDITDAPQSLIELARKPDRTRAIIGSEFVDVSLNEIRDMLEYCHDYDDYHSWVTKGMAIHHATGGSNEGRAIWADWSSQSDKYDPAGLDKWHTFGKCAEPVTLGTIFFEATKNGYVQPVTFNLPMLRDSEQITDPSELPFDTGHIDLLRPPGFAGKLAAWINQNSFYKRERIAASAAIMAIGNLGMHYRDDITSVAPNLMFLCVAGSGTGKEAVQSRFGDIMRSGNMQTAIHGDIKSKQEIIRNLIEHQIAAYCTDEIGEVLKTIENAKRRGGAAYLEGVTGEMMKIFTKSDETLMVSGDVRRDLLADIRKTAAALTKIVDAGSAGADRAEAKLKKLEKFILMIETEGGIPKPFFSLIGFTTAESFEPALSVELAKNGFLNRAFIIQEHDTNPRPNKKYSSTAFPYDDDILRITATGKTREPGERIEVYGLEKTIRTEEPAKALLAKLFDWQWEFAEHHRATTSYEALARRAYEFISKVSLCLAIGDHGIRTVDHVQWAAAFVKRDIAEKIRLVRHVESKDSVDEKTVVDGLKDRILSMAEEKVYRSQLWNVLKRKGVKRDNLDKLVDAMVEKGLLSEEGKTVTTIRSRNG